MKGNQQQNLKEGFILVHFKMKMNKIRDVLLRKEELFNKKT